VKVLFVCGDNAALSVMAQAILRAVAPARFTAYSAGCFTGHALDAAALELLERHHIASAGLEAKDLYAFRASAEARVDLIITLSEAAADEDFSGWPGDPFVAHWTVEGASAADAFWTLMRRIRSFASLPQGKLSRQRLGQRALRLEPGYL
jgi:arsenate reductase